MKQASSFLVAAVLVMSHTAYAGTVARSYEVGTWPGFRSAAISYTFDDGCSNQFAVAIPMFNEFGFKLTLFTITGWSPNWTALQDAAAKGHEVASHTVTHPNLSGLTFEQQTAELKNSRDDINAHITGPNCVTTAWPYCATGNLGLCGQYYIAARGCQGFVEGSTPGDFMNVSSLICGNLGSVQTATNFNNMCDSAAASKGWCVFLIHGIDNDGGYSPLPSATLRASLQYLDTRRGTFWVSTFGNVARYVMERNAVSVTDLASDETHVALQMTDTLDNGIFNYPVTLRRPLPAGWPSARITQKDRVIPGEIVVYGRAGKGIMFDVVPDGGEVILTKAPVVPTGLTATAGPNAVTLDWSDSNDAGVAGYHVYRSTTSDTNYVRLNPTLVTDANYVDANTAPDTTYYYVVTAVDANSYESGYSNEITVRIPAAPAEIGPVSLLPFGRLGRFGLADLHVAGGLKPMPEVGHAARTEEEHDSQHALNHRAGGGRRDPEELSASLG
jgi:hypothetical protein